MSSPFGIRRRLKRLLGMSPPAASAEPAREMVDIHITGPKGEEQSAHTFAGVTILGASGALKRPIASGCSDSTCGTCRVEVIDGAENLSEPSARERGTLKDNGHPAAYRLACRTEVLKGAVKVRAFELV